MGRPLLVLASLPVILALAAVSPSRAAESTARSQRTQVVDLRVDRSGDRLRVSYALDNGFTEEIVEKIAAGIPVRFRHRVEVTTRHWLPLWPRGTVASATVESTVIYDSLTHRYALTRVIESYSRGKGKSEPETHQESTVLEAEARAFMTEIYDFPALDVSSLPVDLPARVRVESALGRKWIVLVPARRIVSADYKLEPEE